jgi:glucans biosynthesis protein C
MERRHDIDWIRVIAIALLLIYHTSIGFQPWGGFIGFITNGESWMTLWTPMTMLNIWRIPLLFYVSGMGLYLAIQNRNWKQLFAERFLRIGLPLVFGSLFIVPLHWYLLQQYYERDIAYTPNMGHLWFLGNILLCVVILAPIFFFFKNKNTNRVVVFIKKVIAKPYFLLFILALFEIEAFLIKPAIFEIYAFTLHGLILGLLAFFTGFLFMMGGEPFWKMFLNWRWRFLVVAIALFMLRYWQMPTVAPTYLLSIESNCWIFSVLSFGYKHLNVNNLALKYLKEAAYPVYILHMAFLFLGSTLIFPLKIGVVIKFALVLCFTFVGSWAFYEFVVRRLNIVRVLFGMKRKPNTING